MKNLNTISTNSLIELAAKTSQTISNSMERSDVFFRSITGRQQERQLKRVSKLNQIFGELKSRGKWAIVRREFDLPLNFKASNLFADSALVDIHLYSVGVA